MSADSSHKKAQKLNFKHRLKIVRGCYWKLAGTKSAVFSSNFVGRPRVLEPNDDIRRLLRLTKRYWIERVKGKLGGSIYLLTMAEMIRRTAERAFETEFPEEDELGIGELEEAASFKEDFYGARRVMDSHEAKSNFLQDLNLDCGVRLRWYVEGNTELDAADWTTSPSFPPY